MKKLLSECVVLKEDKLIFTSMETSLLFLVDINSKEIKIIGMIPDEDPFGANLFGDIILWKDKFVLVPANAHNLWILDWDFSIWKKIPVDNCKCSLKFSNACVNGDKLYMINHNCEGILCIDLNTEENTVIDVGDALFYSYLLDEEKIYLPADNKSCMFILALTDDSITQIDLPSGIFNAINKIDGKIFLAPRVGKDILVVEDDNICTLKTPSTNAIGIFQYKEEILVPSNFKNQSLKIDKDMKVSYWNDISFILCKQVSDSQYVLMDSDATIYIYNVVDCKITEIKIETDNVDLYTHIRSVGNANCVNKSVLRETNINTLNEFINFVV